MIGTIIISYAPALLGMLVIALLVLIRQRKPAYVSFSILLFSAICWLAPQAASLLVSEPLALVMVRLSVLMSNFMPPFFLFFALFYPSAKQWPKLGVSMAIMLPAVIFAAVSFLPGMVESVAYQGSDLILKTGVFYDLQTIFVVGYVVAASVILAWKYRHTPHHQEKTAILMLLFAFLIPLVVGILTNYVWINNQGAQYFLPSTFFITAIIIAYAMIRHKLFDVRLAAVRGAAYILSLLTLAALYYVIAYGISELLLYQSDSMDIQSPFSIGLALVLAFVFQPVKKFFDRLTNNIFFHDNYDTDDFLERLGHELSTASELRDLLQRASNEIGGTIQAEQAFFFVRYGDGQAHQLNAGTARHGALASSEVPVMDEFVRVSGAGAIVVDLLPETEPVYKLLRRHKIAIVLPLTHDGAVLSYLLIGRRRSREYTRRDVRVLETIANELVIAIQNALSVQEVKDINATLQQRVNDATKELRANNKQLQRLDAAKDEFVSMASHQLRTPLTSVKGYISMVLEGDAGHISQTQRQLLEEAFTSSERMVHLIGDFLNVSRLQTGKFMIDTHPTDLVKLVKQEVASLNTTADAHGLKLRFKAPAYFPVLYVDEGKLRQVVMNFIDNAIYYSRENTTITIELAVIDGSAVLQVNDTGIGVPKAEQAHLFTKFFRASNARKQRPDGTGVGLFLAKKVVVAHGGSVLFESTEGKGSTFGFRLPIKKLSSAPTESTEEFKE